MYRVLVTRSAERELAALPAATRLRITPVLRSLAEQPRPRGVSKLVHGPGWRVRVGDYRVLFIIDDEARVVTVVAVAHRREAYRS